MRVGAENDWYRTGLYKVREFSEHLNDSQLLKKGSILLSVII